MKNRAISLGEKAYKEWSAAVRALPEYEREAAVVDLWLALADARRAAGLTQAEVADRMGVSQAQVARIEKLGYDSYTLRTLRRYVATLGNGFTLEISIQIPEDQRQVLEEPNPDVRIVDRKGRARPLRSRRSLTPANK